MYNVDARQDRADPLADQLDDRLEVELLGEGQADLVHDRQLGSALIGLGEQPLRLIEQAGVLEGDAHARGQRGQQSDVGLVVGVARPVLEVDDADDLVTGQDRDAEPRFVVDPADEEGVERFVRKGSAQGPVACHHAGMVRLPPFIVTFALDRSTKVLWLAQPRFGGGQLALAAH